MAGNVLVIYPDNDNVVTWSFMEQMDGSTPGQFVNTGATVAMTLKDPQGASVTGAIGLALTYVTGSEGTYSGVLPYTLTLTPGDGYHLVITATSGAAHATRTVDVLVVSRTT